MVGRQAVVGKRSYATITDDIKLFTRLFFGCEKVNSLDSSSTSVPFESRSHIGVVIFSIDSIFFLEYLYVIMQKRTIALLGLVYSVDLPLSRCSRAYDAEAESDNGSKKYDVMVSVA